MKKAFQYAFIYLLAYSLLFIGGYTWIAPKQTVSLNEKRKLATFPHWSWSNLWKGKFTDSLALYFAEHFIFRAKLIPFAIQTQNLKGLQIEKVKIYPNDNLLDGNITLSEGLLQEDTVPTTDSSKVSEVRSSNNQVYLNNEYFITKKTYLDSLQGNGMGRTSNNVFICNGKAFQFFGGNHQSARAFASVVDRYAEQNPDVKVYAAVVPSNAEFYLPQKYQKMKRSECANIEATYQALVKGIGVDICKEIYAHLDEYLYFNTDHHWTGLGAYYGYVAWCKAAGLEPIPIHKLKRKVIKNYYGTLYHLTQDPELTKNIDSVEYFKSDVKTKTLYWFENQMNKAYSGTYLVEFAGSATAYGVFLGADYPLMHISTELQTNRNCLIIKNSYGNPFTTYLVNHFDNIYAIDYRYFHQSLNQFIKEKKITDIIFLMGVFSTNTPQHVRKVDLLLRKETK